MRKRKGTSEGMFIGKVFRWVLFLSMTGGILFTIMKYEGCF